MVEIDDEMEDKLNDIGVDLGELQRLSRVMQVCLDDKENLNIEDIQTVFQMFKTKIIETKKNFSNIQAELQI